MPNLTNEKRIKMDQALNLCLADVKPEELL